MFQESLDKARTVIASNAALCVGLLFVVVCVVGWWFLGTDAKLDMVSIFGLPVTAGLVSGAVIGWIAHKWSSFFWAGGAVFAGALGLIILGNLVAYWSGALP
jgi:hypothetical protein